jgi:pyridoxamine 5'-phosphate oxidase
MSPRDPSVPASSVEGASLDLGAERRDYEGDRLVEADAPSDPLVLFARWLERALHDGLLDATAMSLSTCAPDGRPSSRMLLLKGQDARGFAFYTRYSTQKCVDLLANPQGALLFHWRELNRQVRIEARLERVSTTESQAYFATRPRLSQLSARAASGLGVVPSAEHLEARVAAEAERWRDQPVPMPDDWGGFRALPERIEFWQGRPNRLHDRLVYERAPNGSWSRYRLAP